MKEIYRSPSFNLEGYIAYTIKYEDGSKATVLAHREIVEQSLGRKLTNLEIIHHKDGNKHNNIISNLEILTRSSHAIEHGKERSITLIKLVCIYCNKEFERALSEEKHFRNQKKAGPFCGKSCVGKWSRNKQLLR